MNGDRSETKARQKLAFLLRISRIMNNEAKIKLVAERSEAEALAFFLQISTEIEAKITALLIYREKKFVKMMNDEVVRKKVRHRSKKFVKKGQMTRKKP